MNADTVRGELRALASPERAASSAWFFQAQPGGYGEGDVFLGVRVPAQRAVARAHRDLPVAEVCELLHSPEHECRLTALLIWREQYDRADGERRDQIVSAYLDHLAGVNNWDLVDTSAPLLGRWLTEQPRRERRRLDRLAASGSVWERRLAMIAAGCFLERGEPAETLRVADVLRDDPHPLVQKAVGWMVRETGRRCGTDLEEAWLLPRYRTLPRTVLRYAIERLPAERRQAYLHDAA